MRLRSLASFATAALVGLLLFAGHPAQAATPTLDDGRAINTTSPYTDVQDIADVMSGAVVYGKYTGGTPVDVYSFTPSQDGEQSISLLTDSGETGEGSEPVLVLVDPTQNTQARELGLPLPDGGAYHTVLIEEQDASLKRSEPVLFQQPYRVFATQKVSLSAGQKYYLVTFDPGQTKPGQKAPLHYAIAFGDAPSWHFTDFFKHFGAWLSIKADTYGGQNPFSFSPSAFGLLLVLIGFTAVLGFWIMREAFTLAANRSARAAYLLVKMEDYTRLAIWGGLFLTVLGGYIYLSRAATWQGNLFWVTVAFIPALVSLIVETAVLGPQVKAVLGDQEKEEAKLPLILRKKLFACFVISTVGLVATLGFAAVILAA